MKTATSPAAQRRLRAVTRGVTRRVLTPPPRLSLSEYADAHRMLSREASAEPGRWRTSRTPYLRAIMDAISDPATERVVIMAASQVGKTEVLLNALLYYMSAEPCPILVMQPTLEMARTFSTDRVSPMVRDSPILRGRVMDPRARDSGNTILSKRYTGGSLNIVGANSPASLASRPIRVVLADEVDRYPASAGTEGDPLTLAFKRTATFWNRKLVIVSTPTIKGASRIAAAYEESTQEALHVPCPHCDHSQALAWGGVTWDAGRPESAVYACEACGAAIEETCKLAMLRRWRFVAAHPERGPKVRGFHLPALCSPFATWGEQAAEFLAAKGNPERLKVFVNTVLAECFDEAGEQVGAHTLYERLEAYPAHGDERCVPRGAAVLTVGVDTQDDRLEAYTWAWGAGEECWLVAHDLIPGDPNTPAPWKALDAVVARSYRHEGGAAMRPAVTFVDAMGHATKAVYAYTRERVARRVFACRGANTAGAPLLGRPQRNNSAKAILYTVGGDTAKNAIMSRFKVEEHGPGYVHLPDWCDREHLEQLTSEKLVTRYVKGRPVRAWLPTRDRNEGLDCLVYAMAALQVLGPAAVRGLGAAAERLSAQGRATGAEAGDSERESAPPARSAAPRPRSGWVNWKR